MNIKGLGIDLVDYSEIEPRLSEAFIKRVLSSEELTIYNTLVQKRRKLSFIAGRFAAKEALAKAFQQFEKPLNFKDVSILPNSKGAPVIISDKISTKGLNISISHTNSHAIAIVTKE